jgi:hypothetical protein
MLYKFEITTDRALQIILQAARKESNNPELQLPIIFDTGTHFHKADRYGDYPNNWRPTNNTVSITGKILSISGRRHGHSENTLWLKLIWPTINDSLAVIEISSELPKDSHWFETALDYRQRIGELLFFRRKGQFGDNALAGLT